MKNVVAAFVVALAFGTAGQVHAQAPDKLLALYVYNFACNGQWPSSTQEFVIGVLSHPNLSAELETITRNRTMKGQPIRIVEFFSAAEISACHVLFVPAHMSELFSIIESRLDNSATMIITDEAGMAKEGSALNFVTVNGKLRFEVNVRALEMKGLRLAPEILELGLKVESVETTKEVGGASAI